jgi:hypothetical protein
MFVMLTSLKEKSLRNEILVVVTIKNIIKIEQKNQKKPL